MISIVAITMDRLHLMQQCVENVLSKTVDTTQIILWDNGSVDGTAEYLRDLADPRIQVVLHPENVGLNAYARACRLATQEYIIELDDDIIDAPQGWDRTLLHAFRAVPRMGYLASNIIDDGKSVSSDIFFRTEKHRFVPREPVNGVQLIDGPIGGYCTMTSRAIYDEVGGFAERPEKFFREDGLYCEAVLAHGYDAAILADLRVFHASGPAYSSPERAHAEKMALFAAERRSRERRNRVKRALEAIPGVPYLNRRLQLWQSPPGSGRKA